VTSFPEVAEAVKAVASLKQLAETQQKILDATAARLGDAIDILQSLQAASKIHGQAIEAIGHAVRGQDRRLSALEQDNPPISSGL